MNPRNGAWKISSEIGRRSILAGTSTRIQGRRLPSRFCRALPAGDCIPWDETSAASGEFRLRRTRRRTLPRFPKNSAKLPFSPALLILCAGSAGRDGSLCSSQRRCMRDGLKHIRDDAPLLDQGVIESTDIWRDLVPLEHRDARLFVFPHPKCF